jgi:hypothetical protein
VSTLFAFFLVDLGFFPFFVSFVSILFWQCFELFVSYNNLWPQLPRARSGGVFFYAISCPPRDTRSLVASILFAFLVHFGYCPCSISFINAMQELEFGSLLSFLSPSLIFGSSRTFTRAKIRRIGFRTTRFFIFRDTRSHGHNLGATLKHFTGWIMQHH